MGVKVLQIRIAAILGLVATGLLALPHSARADERSDLLQRSHAWGRFGKGSWREVKVWTESFDEHGRLASSSSTESRTTIEEVTPERVTLKIENTVEIAGRRIASPPQIVKQGYAGEHVGQTVSIKALEPELLSVAGRSIPCETRQIEILGGVQKEVSLISFASERSLILKRKTTTSDASSDQTTQESVSEVLALEMGVRVLDDPMLHTGYLTQLVQKNSRGVTTTLSWHVPEIPGEVVHHASKKQDAQGNVILRSTLELVGFGVEGEETYRDPTTRRTRRHSKRAR